MSQKLIKLLAGVMLTSCGYPQVETYDKIDYSERQIDSIKQISYHFDYIFAKMKEYTGGQKPIGFIAYDSVYYYSHCIAVGGRSLVKPENCILEYYLTDQEIELSEKAIHYLYSIGIDGSTYNSLFECYTYGLDGAERWEDSRMIAVKDEVDTAFIRKTIYEILDMKHGLVLFKYRDIIH